MACTTFAYKLFRELKVSGMPVGMVLVHPKYPLRFFFCFFFFRCRVRVVFSCLQDAGLENMALEVGTLQGGQIAPLQGVNREPNLGKNRLQEGQ